MQVCPLSLSLSLSLTHTHTQTPVTKMVPSIVYYWVLETPKNPFIAVIFRR